MTVTSEAINDSKNLSSGPASLIQENDSEVLTALSQKQKSENTPADAGINGGLRVATYDGIANIEGKRVDQRDLVDGDDSRCQPGDTAKPAVDDIASAKGVREQMRGGINGR